MTNYEERLKISIGGDISTVFKTESGLAIARGYTRIVIGRRGPYVEFSDTQIDHFHFHIPENQMWRLSNKNVFYIEYRTKDTSNVKIYYQTKIVDYADYKIGMYYISPFALSTEDGTKIITPIRIS
jgi:hypothetical protein